MSDNYQTDQYQQQIQTASLKSGLRVTWIGMVINAALVIFKLWAGFAARSQALIADGIHSLSDLFGDGVVLFGLKWGRMREDENHPYGHARIETISSMIVGLLLLAVGLGITYNAGMAIYTHQASRPGILAIYAAAISVVLKEALYWYTFKVGKKIKSIALIGNAWHHRADALSSVAVLIGVGAVYYNPKWVLADAFAALLVTYFIIKIGINLVWSAFRELSDTAPDKAVLNQLTLAAATVAGVIEVHDMRARHSGSQIFVELHIAVDPELTVRAGHDIARNVKRRLLEEFADVTRVIIHVDPEPKG